ncbi:methyltransferase [Solicola sp. PLA-1-18]|uniref:RraA family protein n=1 Tax=Solicola sp. PLA-1-18 TaxID=3380532 RepID=UPI003B78B993
MTDAILETVTLGGSTSIHQHQRPEPDLLDRFRHLPSANIADAMGRLGAVDARIKPVWDGASVVGAAFTVWTRPGDNRGIHEALALVAPGDVIVINGGGDESRALIGELIGGKARLRGVAGFVIDGAVRDATGLREYQMPVFARSITPAGPYKDGPHALLSRIAVGGVVVTPGDVVVGDEDGVVIVPLEHAETIAAAAERKQAAEQRTRDQIEADLPAVDPGVRAR